MSLLPPSQNKRGSPTRVAALHSSTKKILLFCLFGHFFGLTEKTKGTIRDEINKFTATHKHNTHNRDPRQRRSGTCPQVVAADV